MLEDQLFLKSYAPWKYQISALQGILERCFLIDFVSPNHLSRFDMTSVKASLQGKSKFPTNLEPKICSNVKYENNILILQVIFNTGQLIIS